MNILFVTSAAPNKNPFATTEKRPPLGVGTLISITRSDGHNVFFIDNYLSPSTFIEDGFLRENEIELVGIYSNTICFKSTEDMFNRLQALRKSGKWQGKIAVGGPHPSVQPETIPDYVDYVVIGEGEKAILEIANGTATERIIRSERIQDLDTLPYEPWDIFSKLPYNFGCEWMDAKPVFTMNTSRGCPFTCTFCSVCSIWGRHYTGFSVERILGEIKYLVHDFGAKGIYFREDNFTLNPARTTEFCEALIKSKRLSIEWACESRVGSLLDENMVKLLSAAGCKAVYLGVESGSQRILDMVQKKQTVDQIERAVTLCKKHGIRTYCSMIVGLPGETYQDYLETKALMDRLQPYSAGYNVFVGIPGGPLYKQIMEKKEYEYIDDLGLAYLPGYDVRTEFFHGIDSHDLVDHNFRGRSEFDRVLLAELRKRKAKVGLYKLAASILPTKAADALRSLKGKLRG